MNSLAKYLVEQIEGKTIAVFGGGFKPPTKGHFSVVKQALKQNPEIEEFRVYVGTGERDGISQSQSTMIWNIYAKYLPFKVEIIPSEKAPIRAIYNTAKDNPQSEVLWVIGAREGNEDDFKDIASRTTSVNKYPNLELRTIVSKDGISGTAARNALNQTPEKFTSFLPDELSDEEKQEVVNILSSAPLNEDINDPITVLSVIDPKLNLDEDQIIELFSTNGKFYIYTNEEGEYENEREVDKHDARDYVDYYNARIKRDSSKEEKLGSKLKVLGIESELRFKRNSFSLNEGEYETNKFINKLREIYGIGLWFYEYSKYFELSSIKIPDIKRKQGIGTKVMDAITKHADKNKKPIYLTPDDTLGTPKNVLISFYKSFGFQDKPKNDFLVRHSMVRYPQDYNMTINEGVENIDYKKKIVELTKHMLDQGKNIQPLPKVIFKHDEQEADDFFGKTAYYQPDTQTIVLYVKDRHPKDIVRSYAHEMVHHIQNLENRLGAVTTTDTNEDDNLDKIEREAYLDGNMTFRNWSDTYVGNQMKESNENLFSKNIQESIISDIREYGNLPEYKIDLNDTYDYNPSNNFFEFYDDINNVDVIAKVKSLSKDITEFKFYPIKDGKSLGFIKLSKSNPKIMNTIFKIFLNEVLSKYDKILIQPSDYTRYRLFRAMLSNNLDKKDYKIDTNDNPIGQSSLFIQKPTTNELEEKTKDPFGLTAYAAELGRLREDEGEYKLYLDMDGVVADFDRRFRELSGMAPKEFENKHGKNKFWDFIDEGDNKIKFWVGIPPMPGAQELVSFINSNFDYEMLTAPSIKKQSFTGKRLWIRNWTNKGLFPSKPEINFKSAKNKKDFAAPNHILVDDKPSTIDAWNAAGGIGILFQSAEQVINDLQQYVKKGV